MRSGQQQQHTRSASVCSGAPTESRRLSLRRKISISSLSDSILPKARQRSVSEPLAGQQPDLAPAERLASVLGLPLEVLRQSPSVDPASLNTLHRAVFHGDIKKMTKLLYDASRDINKLDSRHGCTPLHLAVWRQLPECVRFLVEYRWDASSRSKLKGPAMKTTDVNLPDAIGRTALTWAVLLGHTEIASLLVQTKADIGIADHCGLTAFHYAVLIRNQGLLELLAGQGPIPALVDPAGSTLLHHAVRQDSSEMCKFVLDHSDGIESLVNRQDNSGQTPLHLAFKAGSVPLVELLVSAGADMDIADRIGQVPSDLLPRTDGDGPSDTLRTLQAVLARYPTYSDPPPMFHQSSRTSAAIAGTLARTPLVTPDKGEVQATSPPHLPAPIGPAGPLSQPEGSEFAQEPADTGEKIRKERGLADTNATKPSTTTPDGAVAGACSITHVGTDSTIRAKAVVVCPTPTITDAITDTNTDAGTGSGRIEQPSSFPGPSNLEAIAERSATGLDQLSHPPPAALASARVTPPSETTAEHRQDRGRLLGGLSRLFKSHHHDGLVALMLEELNGLSVDGESLFIESPNPEQGAREQVKDIVGKLQAVLSGRVAEKNTRLKILGERLAESLDAAAALQERCQTLAAQVQMLQAAQTKDRACAATPDPPTGSDGTKTCTAPDGDGACSKDLLLRVLVEQQTALQTRLAILQQQLAHRRDAGPTRGALWQVQGQSLWLAFPL